MRSVALALALAAVLSVAVPAQATTTIISEDFESGLGVFTATGQAGINNGLGYVQCCSVTGADLNNHFVAFGSGGQPSGSISTSFNSVLGQMYTLSYDYMGIGSGSDSLRLEITGIVLATLDENASTNLDLLQPTPFPHTFLGTGNPITLIFSGEGSADADAILDNVLLTTNVDVASVPEPATWALMILGFGMMGGALRHRRRKTISVIA